MAPTASPTRDALLLSTMQNAHGHMVQYLIFPLSFPHLEGLAVQQGQGLAWGPHCPASLWLSATATSDALLLWALRVG